MMVKEFLYKGKTLDELKKMSITELAELFNARERRKIKRGFTEQEQKLLKKLETKDTAKTHCRTMIFLPTMVGKTIMIHNGKEFVVVRVTPEMIGLRFGEMALTRKRVTHNSPGVGASRSTAHA
ncbi:MAG: 30S ribosomal protein S19, partial [Nitrospiraceae bacterium]|nr:30S ribosomal protein S19 [Nitrospiraceae bacterium]